VVIDRVQPSRPELLDDRLARKVFLTIAMATTFLLCVNAETWAAENCFQKCNKRCEHREPACNADAQRIACMEDIDPVYCASTASFAAGLNYQFH
jgi:hypothetical protein